MAPVPTIQKKRQQQAQPSGVAASDVYDDLGRPLDSLLRRQKRTDRRQQEDITVNRQHAAQYESDTQKNKLIYRDVFPGRKYKLTLSDTTWMGDDNVVRIGYTFNEVFTQLSVTASAPENNVFAIDLTDSNIVAVDTLEIRLEGATGKVRSYLEDDTTSSSLSGAVARLLDSVSDLISGQDSLQDAIDDLDRRVTALEEAT